MTALSHRRFATVSIASIWALAHCALADEGPKPTPAPAPGVQNTWVVIAAGSAGYDNYRHQADACHAHRVALRSGVPPEQIILMMQDDVAHATENPFKGKLYNKKAAKAINVYKNCTVDYRGEKVTAKLFMDVVTGKGDGKVLKSGPTDRVFLNFVDHGGPGIVAFPHGPPLTVKQLATTLKTMKSQNMFKELLFYMEACESGSMFPHLATDDKIFAVTASNAKESSWGWYCPPKDQARGKHLDTCLGDLFSIAWMEDSDHFGTTSRTIKEQVARVTKRAAVKSHVSQFGDTSFESESIGGFEAQGPMRTQEAYDENEEDSGVVAWDIPRQLALYRWNVSEAGPEKEAAWKKYLNIERAMKEDERVFDSIARQACVDAENEAGCARRVSNDTEPIVDLDCHSTLVLAVHEACPKRAVHNAGGWNDWNHKFAKVLVNICEMQFVTKKNPEQLEAIVRAECARSPRVWEHADVLVI